MGLINFIKRVRAGETEFQKQARYGRANARANDYNEIVQWYIENADGDPQRLPDYDALDALTFRPGHKPILLGYRNDIERKLGHSRHLGTRSQPWITAFERPSDGTVYCAYVILRDDSQQYALMKPYWFLSRGESEKGYRAPVMGII